MYRPSHFRGALWMIAAALAGALLLHLPTRAAPAAAAIYLPQVTSPGGAAQPQPARGGFFPLPTWLTYNAATAVDARGGVHMAFYQSDEGHSADALGQVAFYAYCPGPSAVCADSSRWAAIRFSSTGVNEVQIALTKDGRPRLLIRRNDPGDGYDYEYWACDQQCAAAERWAGLQVNQAAGADLHGVEQPQHSFALDAHDRPRFIWSNGWGNGRQTGIYYAHCDETDCTQAGSWQQAVVETLDARTVTADNATLVFDGDKPRVLTRTNYSGLPVGVEYMECNQNCDSQDGWQITGVPHPAGKMWASWDLALDDSGHPRLGLYEAADPNLTVGGKLFYGWCDASCASQGNPFQLVQVASGEGKNVDLAIDARGRAHMVYDAGERGTIGELWCDAGCASLAGWQRRILETSAQLMREFAPASPLTCDQQQEDRVWLDAIPQVAFDPQGRLIVGYDITNYARCYYVDPADPSSRTYSRVERLWWAARWASFGQP